MPWWSWLVIWASLGIALIGVLVVSAIRLFRKGMAVLGELDGLLQKTELLDRASDFPHVLVTEVAVLQRYSQVYERRRRSKQEALTRREARHEKRLARARALTRVDASLRQWFPARKQ